MARIEDELLAAALRFAVGRARALAAGALQSAQALAASLGAPVPADGAAVEAELAAARADVAALPASVGAADVAAAAAHVVGALTHADRAGALLTGQPGRLVPLLRGLGGAPNPSGLLAQLGFASAVPGAAGLRMEGATLVYELSASGGRLEPPGGGPVSVALGATSLAVSLRLDGGLPRLRLVLTAKDCDVSVGGSFVSQLLSGGGGGVTADLVLALDDGGRLSVGGGVHDAATVPARPSSGLVDVQSVTLRWDDGLDVGAAIGGGLGQAARLLVDGAGVHVAVDPDAVAAGQSSVSVSAKAPDAIGLTIDAGAVNGGGILLHRRRNDRDEFGGALQLRMGPVEVRAVGLLTLADPGAPPPAFSLVVVMSVPFHPPIDLTFGFTLNAVGGLLGVHRTIDTDALRAGMRSHAVDHLLFPDDVVAAAPAIVETLANVFPPFDGGVVVGPMLQLGWGRPISFVTASLGLVLSLPDPKVVLLGQVKVQVPAPELPIVDLKADIIGEFSADRVFVLASLADSRLAGVAVDGDIGFLIRFGGSPEMAITAGGFHPRFTPPAELSGLHRLSVEVASGSILRLREEAYLALTTNSFQLGARAELFAELGPADAHGWLSLDAIVHFSPFAFEADLEAGVSIRVFGATLAAVTLHLHLQGPAPWQANGWAHVEIFLIIDDDVDLPSITWGSADNPPAPLASPRQLVVDALSDPSAWQTRLPAGADGLVTLRADPAATGLLVHPLGAFEVRQRALPLEKVITRVGPSRVPAGQGRISLGVPTLNGVPAPSVSFLNDHFAPAQFLDLTDDQKLSAPAFEDMMAGVAVNPSKGAAFDEARAQQSDLKYETFRTDGAGVKGTRLRDDVFRMGAKALTLAAGAAGRSDLRAPTTYATVSQPIRMAHPAETVLSRVSDLVATGPAASYSVVAEDLAGRTDLQLTRLGVAVGAGP
ncbi:MAG TPA: DUF6603 domain-containing protein [Acidimicrobiales bacterium]|nr:DUF6603 domain-containing protein [Acidimicrobiales bacterium]